MATWEEYDRLADAIRDAKHAANQNNDFDTYFALINIHNDVLAKRDAAR